MQTVRDKRLSMSYVVVSKAKVKRDWLIETTKITIKPSHKSRKCLKQIFNVQWYEYLLDDEITLFKIFWIT